MNSLPSFLEEEPTETDSRSNGAFWRKLTALAALVCLTCALLALYYPVRNLAPVSPVPLVLTLHCFAAILGGFLVALLVYRFTQRRRSFDALLALAALPLALESLWQAAVLATPGQAVFADFALLLNGRVVAALGFLAISWFVVRDPEFPGKTRASTAVPAALAAFILVFAASSIVIPATGLQLSTVALRQGSDLLAVLVFFGALVLVIRRFVLTPRPLHGWTAAALVFFSVAPLYTLLAESPQAAFALLGIALTAIGFLLLLIAVAVTDARDAEHLARLQVESRIKANDAARAEAALDLERELNREKERSLTRQLQDLAQDHAAVAQDLEALRDENDNARRQLEDVTSRNEEAERAISRLAALPREIPNPVLVADESARILHLNAAAEKLVQRDAGGEIERFLPERAPEIIKQCLKEGISMRFLEANAAERVYSWSFHPVEGLHNVHIYVADVSDRIYAEQRLTDALQFQRQVMETAATAIFTIDAGGSVTGVNAEFCEMTGWEESTVLGKPYRDIIEWEDLDEPDPFDLGHVGRILRRQYHVRTVGGDRLTVLMNAELIRDSHSQATMGIGSFVDVSDLNRTRREAERNAEEINAFALNMELKNIELDMALREAQDATHVKSEFLANMSHEIRTPLNGIIGMTELVLDTEMSPQQREFLTMVKTSAGSLLTIINDILDFSKIEAGRMEVESITFEVEEVLRAAIGPLTVRAAEKNIDLWCDLDPRIPHHLMGDPGRLRQILVNLVGNAVKFTTSGSVGVSARLVKDEDQFAYVRFSVEDTGIGIAADRCDAIFESFTQADGSTTRQYGGTGLGLAITRHLVELMEGHIGVESVPGQGSFFHFTIPFTRTSCPIADVHGPVTIPNHILLAMPEIPSRKVIERLMQGENSAVYTVSSAEELWTYLEQQTPSKRPIDAVVLTQIQGGGSESSLLSTFLRRYPDLRSRTLVLTTPLDGVMTEYCAEKGVATYALPVTPTAFLDAVVELTQGSTLAAPELALEADEADYSSRGLRVLLAEDNEVNQRVAAGVLGRMGHHVWIAANGLEALEIVDHQAIDVVFMDIQMPEMDGFEATRALRQRDALTGHHLPIVAMTAHALDGDRERCLDAGMDDYIAKPIQRSEVRRVLAEIEVEMPEAAHNNGSDPDHSSSGSYNTFDLPSTLDLLGHDFDFFCEAADIFLQDGPHMVEQINEAWKRKDTYALERAAHSLKGSVSTFGAKRSMELALRLEDCGRDNCLEESLGILKELEQEFERFLRELAAAADNIRGNHKPDGWEQSEEVADPGNNSLSINEDSLKEN